MKKRARWAGSVGMLALACAPKPSPAAGDSVAPADVDVEPAASLAAPEPPPMSTRLCAGGLHACFITEAREVYCWGLARNLERGKATKLEGLTDVVEVSCGYENACARTADGEVYCWGDEAPIRVEGLEPAQTIGVGTRACAVVEDGTVRCTAPDDAIEQPDGVQGAVQVAVGFYHGCARTKAGQVRCWGRNLNGQLGVSTDVFTTEDGRTHEDLWLGAHFYTEGPIKNAQSLLSSKRFWTRPLLECVREAGIVDTIRDARIGVEVRVEPDGALTDIRAGGNEGTLSPPDTFVACLADGKARGLRIPHPDPKPRTMFIEFMLRDAAAMKLPSYAVLEGATDLDVRGYLSCATTNQGKTMCWGIGHAYDGPGIMGDGFDALEGPEALDGLDGATRVTVGWRSQCVQGNDGSVRCFGAAPQREFGVGPQASDGTVARIRELERFDAIEMGPTVGCGLDEHGRPWCWGSNDGGRLGVGLEEGGRHPPAAVVGLP